MFKLSQNEFGIPTPEHFRKNVEEMEEKYTIVDCVYERCIEEFRQIKLSDLEDKHNTRIVEPFLLKWGEMQRILGYRGVEAIYDRIKKKAFADRIEPLRYSSLKSINLEKLKDLTIRLFNDVMQIEFNSKSGRVKNVGSTAASKIFHLCSPDLFIMWDMYIRRGYGKANGDGKDYFKFLIDTQKLWTALDDTIKDLQKKYGKRATRVIDEYNWLEFNPR